MIPYKPYLHYDLDIERAVIGQLLLEPLAMGRVYSVLEAEQFYHTNHRLAMTHLRTMYDQSIPIDLYTATSFIVSQGIDTIDGINVSAFLAKTTNHVVSTAHLEYHAFILREQWQRREIIKLKAAKLDGDPVTDLELINKRLTEILGNRTKKDWCSMEEMLFELMNHQSEMAQGKREFITSGFKRIDKENGGFYGGQMIVLGARPSVGKSALMGQMALAQAKTGRKVGIISLEMDNVDIAARLSSIETNIPFATIYRDIAKDEDLHRRFYDTISRSTINLPIYVSDKTKVSVPEIRAKAIKLKTSHGCDLLMVDYLQLVDGTTENKNYNREQEVARMSRGLKLMAMELQIPVVVLCQLNRQATHRTGDARYPQLSDLRESGAIEQDADIVMFLHRDYMSGIETREDGGSTEGEADILIRKWRNGSIFHLPVNFDPTRMKFSEKGSLQPFNQSINDYHDDNPF